MRHAHRGVREVTLAIRRGVATFADPNKEAIGAD